MTPKELKEFDPLDFSKLDAMIAAAPVRCRAVGADLC